MGLLSKDLEIRLGVFLLQSIKLAYELSDGRVRPPADRFPVLLLRVKGRRTGTLRTVALTYVGEGDRLAVIGSRGGDDRPRPGCSTWKPIPWPRCRLGAIAGQCTPEWRRAPSESGSGGEPTALAPMTTISPARSGAYRSWCSSPSMEMSDSLRPNRLMKKGRRVPSSTIPTVDQSTSSLRCPPRRAHQAVLRKSFPPKCAPPGRGAPGRHTHKRPPLAPEAHRSGSVQVPARTASPEPGVSVQAVPIVSIRLD